MKSTAGMSHSKGPERTIKTEVFFKYVNISKVQKFDAKIWFHAFSFYLCAGSCYEFVVMILVMNW